MISASSHRDVSHGHSPHLGDPCASLKPCREKAISRRSDSNVEMRPTQICRQICRIAVNCTIVLHVKTCTFALSSIAALRGPLCGEVLRFLLICGGFALVRSFSLRAISHGRLHQQGTVMAR